MRLLRATILGALMLGLASCGSTGSQSAPTAHSSAGAPNRSPAEAAGPNAKSPVPADAHSVQIGRAVYAKQCQSCHGSRGKGDGPAARRMNTEMPDLTDREIAAETDDELFNVITKGSKPMPAFKNRLSEQQRWDVVRFVRVAFATGHDGKP